MPVTAPHPVFDPTPVPARGDRWAIEDLVGPFGVVTEPQRGDTRGWLPPEVSLYVASSGDVSTVRGEDIPGPPGVGGAGRGVNDPALARRVAICEAVERYAMMHARRFELITATAAELGADALPLDDVARCSSAELRRSGCPLVLPDPDAPIRWVEGIELISREPRLVPLVMSHMLPTRTRQENFWLPISTGCAIHRTPITALLSGLYETIERDALSVAWLRSLPLPRIDPSSISPATQQLVDWYRDRQMVVHLFDATTDVAIPSVYCVMEAPNDTRVAQNVACATGFDIPAIAEKAILEAAAVRAALKERLNTPRRYRDFSEPIDGAVYMGRASRRKAFSFLLDDVDRRPASMPATRTFDSAEAELAHVLRLLGDKGMAVYAVDMSPREVEQVGYCVVRVLVPAMQPMSLIPLAQYRGHARLRHEHPAATGVQRTRELNPWPQPMP
ncbi:YcaO-like family protein [Labedaea rhizosphaerae]|uniref:Ribosomal protein S12 methylthiotransferase accessory factor n=1 Tax=Labedaea rhizosphaerae TaxID=598644 RepID=A0A4R6S127_LABRH|nr:YcaO-like family protein [Labedaea rhizosphaerae]TDP92904.1 ribosomal protein S12 methylthiotransferase accessory factor [Labedaea rhizosphaerae]